jgi:cation:H+ antiporter
MTLAYIALFSGLIILAVGSDQFVHGAAAISKNFGIPTLVIGMTIVGFATSVPEIFVSIMAALNNNIEIALGNAIGSNIANIGLVIGITALFMPITFKSTMLIKEYKALLIVTAIPPLLLALSYSFPIERIIGPVLLLGFVFAFLWFIKISLNPAPDDPITSEFESELPKIITNTHAMILIIIGLVLMVVSSKALIFGAVTIARYYHVSELIIGLTIIAIGTSLPELATSFAAVKKKEYDLAIGNIFGSNIYNILAVMGIGLTIRPFDLTKIDIIRDIIVMILFTILFGLLLFVISKNILKRIEGLSLFICFCAYQIFLFYTLIH